MTTREPLRVLLVEDEDDDALLVLRELRRGGFEPDHERVQTAPAMREALARRTFDLVLSDFSMPELTALEAIATLRATGLDVPLIVVSGTIGEETAVEVLRAGARDFVVKGRLARLVPAIRRELQERAARASGAERLRRAEEHLLQAQKMEAIGRLAGGVAHDFNNLLSIILSYSELLITGLRPEDPTRADLKEILGAAERATELTRQLLAFGRKQVLQPRPVDLRDIVRGMAKLLGRVLREDVELAIVAPPEPVKTAADPGQLEQIVMNLAVNARDAMPKGGKLVIELRNVELDDDDAAAHPDLVPGRYVLLAVSDTGTGMTREVQEHIFEPFFTTKEIGHGTGLGLATVFGIVKQSGGHIWVYSEPGTGTTFKVYLPRTAYAPVTIAPPVLDSEPPLGNETVLLVEDDPAVFALARTLLQRAGYHVLEATTAGDAVMLCETHPATIHLLLTDVVMPRMSGPQLAARVQALRPKMRILYMSGYTDSAVVHQGIVDSDVAFLQKPITRSALLRMVREVLDREPGTLTPQGAAGSHTPVGAA